MAEQIDTNRQQNEFEEIVNRYQREMINFHYRFVGNRFEAEDLAQETFVKAYFNLKTLKDTAKLKSWLYQIARHVAIDFFRKNKKHSNNIAFDPALFLNFASDADIVDSQQELIDGEISRELQRCIDLLGQEDQRIIKLLYYEGFSYKEIAELMDVNHNTLKSRLHRARRSLLDIIKSNKFLKDIVVRYSQNTIL